MISVAICFLVTESSSTLASFTFIAGVTLIAAAINSVAGGGRILTFSALAAVLPADASRLVIANATSTVGLWPGTLSAAWDYRHERNSQLKWSLWLLIPSITGSVLGTALILILPTTYFDSVVPLLIFLAATLFAVQPYVSKYFSKRIGHGKQPSIENPEAKTLLCAATLQFFIGMYGGYFGAGNGILMLASLSGLGLGDTHRLNAFKNLLAMVINACAAFTFVITSFTSHPLVAWPEAGIMAVAAVIGGIIGGRLARQYHPNVVRHCVAVIGYGLACYYFIA